MSQRCLTSRDGAFLEGGVKHETIDIILFHDPQTDGYEVSARIGTREVFLRRFTASDAAAGTAAAFMARWVRDRGYEFCLGSGRRVDQAQRTGACLLRLPCERRQ